MIEGIELLYQRIADAMKSGITEPWSVAEYHAMFYAGSSSYEAEYVRDPAGTACSFRPDKDGARAIRDLRQAFRETGQRVWGQVLFVLHADGSFKTHWGYEGCDANGDLIWDEEVEKRRHDENWQRITTGQRRTTPDQALQWAAAAATGRENRRARSSTAAQTASKRRSSKTPADPVESKRRLEEESALLARLLQKAFQMAGESVPLGFDVASIQPTLAQLPEGPITGLEPLFASVWPSKAFHLGQIELFGPERINHEHSELLPGCVIVQHGFLGIGSDGAGTLFSYCVEDRRVYLIPHEYVAEDAVYAKPWNKLEVTPANIKAISEESWDSLGKLLVWAYAELLKMESESQ